MKQAKKSPTKKHCHAMLLREMRKNTRETIERKEQYEAIDNQT
jgi:hypothetical protein